MNADRFQPVNAPWSPELVAVLNQYQNAGEFYPYTCGNSDCRRDHPNDVLIATTDGWRCSNCDYTQNWSHTPPTMKG